MNKTIHIKQGADHVEIFNIMVLTVPGTPYDSLTNPYIPLDLSTYSAVLTVRSAYDGPIVLQLNLTNGITISSNVVTVLFLGLVTQNITFVGGYVEYVYDLELLSGPYTKRPLQGKFKISRNVTY